MSKGKQNIITLTLFLASFISIPIFKSGNVFATLFMTGYVFDKFMDYVVRREDDVTGFKNKQHLRSYLILLLSTVSFICWIQKDRTSYEKEYCISEIERICETGYEFTNVEDFSKFIPKIKSTAEAKSLLLGFMSLAMAEDTANIISDMAAYEEEHGSTEGYTYDDVVFSDNITEYTGINAVLKEYSKINYKDTLNKYFAKESDSLADHYIEFMQKATKDTTKGILLNNGILLCTYIGIVSACCFVLRILWAKRKGLPIIREVE